MFEFTCQTARGEDLCFFGGVCISNATTQINYCDCPAGFERDFTLFHSSNCAIPQGGLAIGVGISSFFWLLVLIWLLLRIYGIEKKVVYRIALAAFTYHASVEMILIGLVAQDGFFEVSLVGMCILFTISSILMKMVTTKMFQFVRVVLDEQVERMERYLNIALAVDILFTVVVGSVSMAYCRAAELWEFDALIVLLAGTHYAIIMVFSIIAHRYTNEFVKALNETKQRVEISVLSVEEYERLIVRVQSMKLRWIFVSFSLCFCAFFFVFIRLILGSIPFLWLMLLGFYNLCFAGTIGIASLFPQYQKSTSSEREEGFNKKRLPRNTYLNAMAASSQKGVSMSNLGTVVETENTRFARTETTGDE
jgi:hypothetical protein